jgi:hypothetical protein
VRTPSSIRSTIEVDGSASLSLLKFTELTKDLQVHGIPPWGDNAVIGALPPLALIFSTIPSLLSSIALSAIPRSGNDGDRIFHAPSPTKERVLNVPMTLTRNFFVGLKIPASPSYI